MRWSPAPVFTGDPSLNQETVGWGKPDTPQLRVSGEFLGTVIEVGFSVIIGGDPEATVRTKVDNTAAMDIIVTHILTKVFTFVN